MIRLTFAQAAALGLTDDRPSKYRSRKTVVDGIRFDSQREADRYGELKLLERTGEITGLELQPVYVLQDGPGLTIKYRADFRYRQGGRVVVEDVKGVRTKEYRLKKKLLLQLYPELDFRET